MNQRYAVVAMTRARIQECALSLFREQGLAATTVNHIADAAGVAPRTFFRYFRTKEATLFSTDLLASIVDRYRCLPPELSCIQALDLAIREFGVQRLTPEDEDRRTLRRNLRNDPGLRRFTAQLISETTAEIAAATAVRLGPAPGSAAAAQPPASQLSTAAQLAAAPHGDLRPLAVAAVFRSILEQHYLGAAGNRASIDQWRSAFLSVLGGD